MKNLIILGAGDFAREIYNYMSTQKNKKKIRFKGFLDCNSKTLVKFKLNNLYLGNEDKYKFLKNDLLLIAIADPNKRKKIYLKLKENKKIKFFNYIHETAIINKKTVKMGDGNIIGPNCVVTHNINLGKFNILNTMVSIGHDVEIRSFNTLSSHCDITGKVNIGSSNFFGSRVSVLPGAKIGNSNKFSSGSVVYKKLNNNEKSMNKGIFHGNPSKRIGDN
jgi:sugar O-acyltransferase (sialic acid O-acetyltransferase NeuD family)